jgi:hypothetical protein
LLAATPAAPIAEALIASDTQMHPDAEELQATGDASDSYGFSDEPPSADERNLPLHMRHWDVMSEASSGSVA